LGREKTLVIAEALLDCALEDAAEWQGPIVIAPADDVDSEWAVSLLPESRQIEVFPQKIGNLGQRLNALDKSLRSVGYSQLVYIGSDAPVLQSLDYIACQQSLQYHDTVLIPASDGGVALMASNLHWPALADLPWSTSQLGKALVVRCKDAGQSVVLLEQRADVDEFADCVKLISDLNDDPRPARQALLKLIKSI
jgi:glycosyltransferase A (GT-A) superfamily protein (DUF2064 family)